MINKKIENKSNIFCFFHYEYYIGIFYLTNINIYGNVENILILDTLKKNLLISEKFCEFIEEIIINYDKYYYMVNKKEIRFDGIRKIFRYIFYKIILNYS